ncbi:hypothetical protein CDD83_2113 [Cordyceps sp. RAO-2017]|nr:hypothetical protein CDD83_2113 [Cordyceps sp. RAO-2017]
MLSNDTVVYPTDLHAAYEDLHPLMKQDSDRAARFRYAVLIKKIELRPGRYNENARQQMPSMIDGLMNQMLDVLDDAYDRLEGIWQAHNSADNEPIMQFDEASQTMIAVV